MSTLAYQAPYFALPVIVFKHVDSATNGSFYVAWGIVAIAFYVPSAIGQALLAEGGKGGEGEEGADGNLGGVREPLRGRNGLFFGAGGSPAPGRCASIPRRSACPSTPLRSSLRRSREARDATGARNAPA